MKTKTTTNAKDNRARLLNIAAGGDGNISAWIEKVTYDGAPAGYPQHGYIVHVPAQAGAGAMQIELQSEDAARSILRSMQTGAKPRTPEDKAEDVAALLRGIPVTDNGRHIPYGNK